MITGIATRYGMDGQVRAKFCAPVQTGPETQPASCTMGTRSLSRWYSGRCMVLTIHPI